MMEGEPPYGEGSRPLNGGLPEVTAAQRDLGARREINENSIVSDAALRRSDSYYIGLRLPKRPGRPRPHRASSRRHHSDKPPPTSLPPSMGRDQPLAPDTQSPSQQIQQLLSEGDESNTQANIAHSVFCEMDVLYRMEELYQWRETARWVKYEEDVEEGGMRWSKPHVASLSLHSLFELRSSLTTGACILEMDAHNIGQIADILLDTLVNQKLLEEPLKEVVKSAIVAPHWFQHQKSHKKTGVPEGSKMSMKRTFSELGRTFSMKSKGGESIASRLGSNPTSQPNLEVMGDGMNESPSCSRKYTRMGKSKSGRGGEENQLNQHFMRKIPEGAEAANILVGELDCLKYQVCAFIRLCDARNVGEITEVPIPSRFLFLLLGPPGSQQKNVEVGRSMSTIMVDEVFREVAYKARGRQDILAGVDEFLDQVTALPPGEWDPKIRIEPPESVPCQKKRKVAKQEEGEEEEEESHGDPTLRRTGRLFGGLIEDIKRKIPFYVSDFKDALHIQCFASTIFLYLATLTPNVTFGGLLGQATDQYMGTMECILSAAINGVLFALLGGQPLNILGSTGPMLVLEMILYNFCKENELDFLPFRAWIGLWTTLLLILVVAFDLSALVRYITRFTEESFASLIAVIFIVKAFQKLIGITKTAPVNTDPSTVLNYTCACFPPPNITGDYSDWAYLTRGVNETNVNASLVSHVVGFDYLHFNKTGDLPPNVSTVTVNWTSIPVNACAPLGGLAIEIGCHTPFYVADVFFLSILLFLGTFTTAFALTNTKNSSFFPSYVRQTLSDFAVLIAIVLMVLLDFLIGIPTPKLEVPEKFQPSSNNRGWFINPISDKNPPWLILAAVVPALLAVILIFMDQQITAVIVNRKENKLKKGSGYHLDLFVVAFCIGICSLLGLPWYVAATVSALAHIMSLKKESECTAPGERPMFLGVREQRVTALLVGILSGASVLFTSVLRHIPMAVLYGVFLYMGVAALRGMQFIDRMLLFFKPGKYQPDYIYLRHVPIRRVHLFTALQILCLIVLWVIKTIDSVSIVFPIMVLGTCFVRKFMDKIFPQHELKWLDDLMPEDTRKEKEDERKKLAELDDEAEEEALLSENYDKVLDINTLSMTELKHQQKLHRLTNNDHVNISQEVARTGIWLQLRRDSKNGLADMEDGGLHNRHKKKSHHRSNGKHHHHHHHHRHHNGHRNNENHPEETETELLNRENLEKTTFYMGDEEDHKV